ncbi:cytochrome oxidase assembly protein-domain-containing protein [Chytridium lagenaria]|nr:cytochrome oxidase assembly protein-domain-containing protein [Chytridium lagenaria]
MASHPPLHRLLLPRLYHQAVKAQQQQVVGSPLHGIKLYASTSWHPTGHLRSLSVATSIPWPVQPSLSAPLLRSSSPIKPTPSPPSSTRPSSSTTADPESFGEAPSRTIVGYWYLGSAILVFGIVALGGLTRLTESGLSITEWNLITGMKPPRSEEEWNVEFAKYKDFPEFKLRNQNMSMDEFKFIFYMEWAHRMVGRLIGLAFVLPGAYFAYRGYMTKSIRNRSLAVALLIGSQGVLGWYMVKSGLKEELMQAKAFHGVSQYWLSAHLGGAFVIYSFMILTGLEILKANALLKGKAEDVRAFLKNPGFSVFKRYAAFTAVLVLLTALSGGFVAGLDAGLIYNEFPYMGDGIVPSDMWAYAKPESEGGRGLPWWRNLLENPSAVQFDHRFLATSTATAVSGLWLFSRGLKLPKSSRLASNVLLGVVGMQFSLGLATLLYLVPVPLAAAHQSGSLALLTTVLWLVHTLRVLPK